MTVRMACTLNHWCQNKPYRTYSLLLAMLVLNLEAQTATKPEAFIVKNSNSFMSTIMKSVIKSLFNTFKS